MSNRIQHLLPVTNRLPVFAPARGMMCGSFVALSIGAGFASGQQSQTVYEIAAEAARVQVAAKRRLRAYSSTAHLWN